LIETLQANNQQPTRQCGECGVCCVVGEVREGKFIKPAHTPCQYLSASGPKRCTLFGKSKRPGMCGQFQCAWLRGYGQTADRPDKSNVMISINHLNKGTWIFAIETKPDAFKTTGKQMILDTATKVNLPVIVVKAESRPPHDYGDYAIVRNSLKDRAQAMIGRQLGWLDQAQEFGIYKLVVTPKDK